MKQKNDKTECDCEECKDCCWRNPGWFGSIKEIEGAAKIKNMSVKEFCKEYLIQEWWAGNKEHLSIPAPRRNFERGKKEESNNFDRNDEIKNNGKGFVRATWGHNFLKGWACIFLTDDEKCSIHKSKPGECKDVFACQKLEDEVNEKSHRAPLVIYWEKHQDFISKIKDER